MNVMLFDGTVRCADHFDASSYDCETSEPCTYCSSAPASPSVPVTMLDDPWFDEPRYHVWHVSSADNPPATSHWDGSEWVPEGRSFGTSALVTDYLESDNGLCKIVADFNAQYRAEGPVSESGFGPVIREFPGVRTRYTRLTWERLTTWGGRVSDMILVAEIPEH